MDATPAAAVRSEVELRLGSLALQGSVGRPEQARGVVVFAHGSGSGRHSPRNQFVAAVLEQAGLATLLFDLRTIEEEEAERATRHLRFDIALLAERLGGATAWLATQAELAALPVGYFGASTGAAAALAAAAQPAGRAIAAVVSRGGRPDLAGPLLAQVRAPTLLIVGSRDGEVIELNRRAQAQMRAPVEPALVPGASHLFEEPGTLAVAARLAADWFGRYLPAGAPA